MRTIKVVVNGRSLSRRVTGVERYASEMLGNLGERVQVARPGGNLQGWSGHAWEQFLLPARLPGSAILWSPANTGPIAVANQVLTVHDLTPLEHPEWFKPAFATWYRWFLPVLVRQVKRVITTSEYIRRKVLDREHLSPERVVTIPAGVNREKFYRQDAPQQYGRYILFVGSIEPRKNLAVLLNAWNLVERKHPDVSLVIVGTPGPVFRKVQLAKNIRHLHFTGYLPDQRLPALYSGADMFVLPSLEEGFGLPALEAMACGTPVVASDRGALPEVVGEAGLLFNPIDPPALAAIISQCLSDPQLRKTLSQRGKDHVQQFSWRRSADLVWQTLQGAL